MLFASQIQDLKSYLPWVIAAKEKKSLRAIIEQRRRVYDKEQAASDSLAIVAKIEQLPWFREAKVVMLYYPIRNEVNLLPLVQKYKDEKTFLLPVTHSTWIEPRRYEGEDKIHKGQHHQIPEPLTEAYSGKIDLILVPGVAFDKDLNRLGRGGGYYDKFLRKQKRVHKVGVGYDFQLRQSPIPHQYFDQKLDAVVTPSRSIGL